MTANSSVINSKQTVSVEISTVEKWVQKNLRLAVITTVAFAALGITAVCASVMLAPLSLVALSGLTAAVSFGASLYFALKCIASYSRANVPENENASLINDQAGDRDRQLVISHLNTAGISLEDHDLTAIQKIGYIHSLQEIFSILLEKSQLNRKAFDRLIASEKLCKALCALNRDHLLWEVSSSCAQSQQGVARGQKDSTTNYDRLIKVTKNQCLSSNEVGFLCQSISLLQQARILQQTSLDALLSRAEDPSFITIAAVQFSSLFKVLQILQNDEILNQANFTTIVKDYSGILLKSVGVFQVLLDIKVLSQIDINNIINLCYSFSGEELKSILQILRGNDVLELPALNELIKEKHVMQYKDISGAILSLKASGILDLLNFKIIIKNPGCYCEILSCLREAEILTQENFISLIQAKDHLKLIQPLALIFRTLQDTQLLTQDNFRVLVNRSELEIRSFNNLLHVAKTCLWVKLSNPQIQLFISDIGKSSYFRDQLLVYRSSGLPQDQFNEMVQREYTS